MTGEPMLERRVGASGAINGAPIRPGAEPAIGAGLGPGAGAAMATANNPANNSCVEELFDY